MTYSINAYLVDKFEERLKKFTNKFNKYGEGAIEYTKSDEYYDEKSKSNKVDITVSGQYCIKGYRLIATLDFDEASQQNLIRKANQDYIVPEKYRTSTACDHCHTNAKRIHTVLLQNEDNGEYIQVGRTCVKDYLNCDISHYACYLACMEDIEDMSEEFIHIVGSKHYYNVEALLALTIKDVAYLGYVSKDIAYYQGIDSTFDNVMTEYRKLSDMDIEKKSIEYAEKIKEIVEVINSMDDTTSDYIYNLKILLSKKVVEYKNIAILISAVACYNKEMKKREATKKESETIKSEYIGNVGDKVSYEDIRAEVVGRYDTQYGVNVIYRFMINGNILIWKTTTGFIDCNLPVSIRGTIKAHNDFRGVKQTELTRCRVVQ